MNIKLLKIQHGLVPADEESLKWYNKLKLGSLVHSDFKLFRNPGLHRKFFALIKIAYDQWSPGDLDTKWGKPVKNFQVFRKNLTILAGYGEPVFNIDGSFKMEAKSISFAKMEQDEFEKLYSSVIDAILERIPQFKDYDYDKMNDLVNTVLHFA